MHSLTRQEFSNYSVDVVGVQTIPALCRSASTRNYCITRSVGPFVSFWYTRTMYTEQELYNTTSREMYLFYSTHRRNRCQQHIFRSNSRRNRLSSGRRFCTLSQAVFEATSILVTGVKGIGLYKRKLYWVLDVVNAKPAANVSAKSLGVVPIWANNTDCWCTSNHVRSKLVILALTHLVLNGTKSPSVGSEYAYAVQRPLHNPIGVLLVDECSLRCTWNKHDYENNNSKCNVLLTTVFQLVHTISVGAEKHAFAGRVTVTFRIAFYRRTRMGSYQQGSPKKNNTRYARVRRERHIDLLKGKVACHHGYRWCGNTLQLTHYYSSATGEIGS